MLPLKLFDRAVNRSRSSPGVMRLVLCCLVAGLGLSACGSVVVDGSSYPAADLGTATSASTTTTPALVPAAGVEDKLLTPSELAAIVGDVDMSEVESYTSPPKLAPGFEPRECEHRARVATALAYQGKGRQATVGNTNRGVNGRVAAQVISVWENRKQARHVVDSVRIGWAFCHADEQFTVAGSGGEPDQYWVAGQISADGETRASSVIERREPSGRTCHSVVAVQANIGVEARACGDGDTAAQANEIVDRILARFPS